jgi:DeoR/GlpR family transcriptional regulator of sugar metabolism
LLGGKVDTRELSISGGYPEEMLKEYIADRLFLGVAGVSVEYGFTDYKMEEIRVKRQMIKSAKKVIVLADHIKFNHIAPIKICELNAVNKIITDRGVIESVKTAVESFGVEVAIADNNWEKA